MAEITYHVATDTDIEPIQNAARISWHATYVDIFSAAFINSFVDRHYSTDALCRAIHGKHSTFYVAKDDAEVVGFCNFGGDFHADSNDILLYRLYVVPSYWRRGIGSRLLEMMEDKLRADGVDEYGLYVHAQNTIGLGFYRKHGFTHRPERDRIVDGEWYMVRVLS